ncbi:hypothetical protein FC48_GL000663 [Ligilactobacillus murinus DSM 20452 = NBRC 14221]|uniref:Uncharacterized protein n=1 Tax=Ligilactobacillus murinus DSM 20452 = NBRC 14221 TaxID=1423772 RepID=A0A0R2BEK3_9LACO|nr:hypothetical protein FC48_GL000663 [Ligilactobacillus murinus DSM 20452 = NBRC 14221]
MVTRPFFIDILVYISKNAAYIRLYQRLLGMFKGTLLGFLSTFGWYAWQIRRRKV